MEGFDVSAVTLIREILFKRAGQVVGEAESRMWRARLIHVKAAHARLSFDNILWVRADEMNCIRMRVYSIRTPVHMVPTYLKI